MVAVVDEALRRRFRRGPPEELVALALESLDGRRRLKTGLAYRVCARILRRIARRWDYCEYAAWALSDVDPFLGAALRLECHVLPCQPEYAWPRLVREHADAASNATEAFFADLAKQNELSDALSAGDGDAVRRLLVARPRLAAFKSAATGGTPLHALAETTTGKDGLRRFAELLAAAGADAGAVDYAKRTPLHAAAAALKPGLVEVLAQPGALPRDAAGRSPLHLTAAKLYGLARTRERSRASIDACAIARTLCHLDPGAAAARDARGETPLLLACSSPNTAALASALLEDEDPKVDRNTVHEAMLAAARAGAARTLAFLWERCSGEEPPRRDLVRAAERSPRGLACLVKLGVDVHDLNGWTPLHLAALAGDEGVCKLVLSAGRQRILWASARDVVADERVDKLLLGATTSSRRSPFDSRPPDVLRWSAAALAASRGHVGVVAWCVRAPPPEEEEETIAVLTSAILGGTNISRLVEATPQVVRLLNVPDRQFGGALPLLLAASLGRCEAVADLLARGADANARRTVAPAKKFPEFDDDTTRGLLSAAAETAEARDANASRAGESSDRLWERLEPEIRRDGAARIAALFAASKADDDDDDAAALLVDAARAMLVVLKKRPGGDPWLEARRVSRRPAFAADLVRARDRPARDDDANDANDDWIVDAAARCDRVDGAHATAARLLGAWLRAVVAEHPAVNNRVGALREDEARPRDSRGVGAAAAALGGPGAPRGDVRGPARIVREVRDRAHIASLLLSGGFFDLERRDDEGLTLLGLACARGYWDLARDLVDAAHPDGGADPRSQPLALAPASLVPDLLRKASAWTRAGALALATALRDNDANTAALLVARGATNFDDTPRSHSSTVRGGGHALFSRDEVTPTKARRLAALATAAREKNFSFEERAVGGTPRTLYSAQGRAVDDRHVLWGLVVLPDDRVALEDGSAASLEDLATDPKLYWKLRVAPRPPVHTVLHAAAAAGEISDCLFGVCPVTCPDARGRTPLGLAIARGRRPLASAMLARLEDQDYPANPDFDALCTRPAVARAARLKRDLELELDSGAKFEGAEARLADVLRDVDTLEPTRVEVAALWCADVPLESAERARAALRELSLAPSDFGPERVNFFRVQASVVPRLKRILASRGEEKYGALEATLALFHFAKPPDSPEEEEADIIIEGTIAPPEVLLREVRGYWAGRRDESWSSSSSRERLEHFLAIWRSRPRDVRRAIAAARRCLSWLRRIVAAKVLATAVDDSARVVENKRRVDRIEAQLARAESAVSAARAMAARRRSEENERRRECRCIALIQRSEWVVFCAEEEEEAAAYRSNLVDCVRALLSLDDDKDDDDPPPASTVPPGGVEAALALLNAMRRFDLDRARRAAPRRSAAIIKAKGLAAVLDAAPPPGLNEAGAAALFWIKAVLHAVSEGPPPAEEEENVLLDAIRNFGDDDAVLPRLVDHLGAERCARLATRQSPDGCALELAARGWAPCALTALLRAGAKPPPSLLRTALAAAPRPPSKRAIATLKTVLAASSPDDPQQQLLDLAAAKGYLQIVDALLSAGASATKRLSETLAPVRTPLHAAAAAGDRSLCHRLAAAILRRHGLAGCRGALCCAHGHPPDANKSLAFQNFESSPVLARLRQSQRQKCDEVSVAYGHYPIHLAIRGGHVAVVSFLLAALQDPEAACGESAAARDDPVLRRHYRDAVYGKNLLHEAAFARRPTVLAALLRFGGMDVEAALHFPPANNTNHHHHRETTFISLSTTTTPLDIAVRRNCPESVAILLRSGAAPRVDHVHQSALRGHGAVAIVLLNTLLLLHRPHDVDAPLSDITGETMLHVAARHGNAELVQVLLASGASLRARDAFGATPVHCAVAAGQAATTRLLATFCHDYDKSARLVANVFQLSNLRRSRF
ncbi:hypothetical protein CTAYLR_010099 [Chrysophaeum taylorii]|uniref:PARP n=1 Tax=Chrysophaeum taylorii TaxID=2483200 RepID=A0AAD7XJS7_9STRA|nr:hypothetical protein CTAYLR_010099 [Chrysophaeum taylorii]